MTGGVARAGALISDSEGPVKSVQSGYETLRWEKRGQLIEVESHGLPSRKSTLGGSGDWERTPALARQGVM